MLARNLHHVALPVQDFERSRKFYEDLLGLEQAERPNLGLPGAWYNLGGAQLHIIQTPQGADVGRPADSLTPLATHVALAIEDYASTLFPAEGTRHRGGRDEPCAGPDVDPRP